MAKKRIDFVTNSSSTAYIITNKTDNPLPLVEFVKENPQLLKDWNAEYGNDGEDITMEELIESAEGSGSKVIKPGSHYMSFGDEDGTVVGRVFDYILREGGSSERFAWEFEEWLR